MSLEIERKFLVAHNGWKTSVVRSARIRDGLIAIQNGRKARVRILDDIATIAIKGPHKGPSRPEFEYPVPMTDAEEMLRFMCDDRILEKVRHYVPHRGLTWEIDVYSGLGSGNEISRQKDGLGSACADVGHHCHACDCGIHVLFALDQLPTKHFELLFFEKGDAG
jgi:CYTH domain-containing protein